MCHVIYAVLPPGCDPEPLRRIGKPFGLALRPIPEGVNGMPEGTAYYATARYCDCGTILGSRLRESDDRQYGEPTEADLARLRRKGWSESRISRWAEDKRKSAQLRAHRPDSYGETPEQQLQRWLTAIHTLLTEGRSPWLGVCYYWLSGAETALTPVVNIRRQDVTADLLLTLQEGVLYRFTP